MSTAGQGICLRISSATASQKTALGDRISINYANPINCKGKRVRLLSCSFTYAMPNVSSTFGNNYIRFYYDGDLYEILLAKGLYGLDELNQAISEYLQNTSATPDNLLTLSSDDSTSFINLHIKTTLPFSMTFDSTNVLFRDMLGFSGAVSTSVDYIRESNSRASLNRDVGIMISASFASGSYLNETGNSNVIGYVPLSHSPGSLITYSPYNTTSSPVNTDSLQSFSIWLTNQAGVALDMMQEDWVIELELF